MVSGSPRKSATEVFNELSPAPSLPIKLSDGRIVQITGWEPKGGLECANGFVPVTIHGLIYPDPNKIEEVTKRESISKT